MSKTIVFYHGSCPDGFGGAYAAWKKFGDTAEYVPLHRGETEWPDTTDATVYFIDFTYEKETMDRFVAEAERVVVLDHHEGVQDVVEAIPEHVYDSNRSGATIAWDYFHPDTPRPELLSFIEDDDLFRFALPETRGVLAYLGVHPFTFPYWDEVSAMLERDRDSLLRTTTAYGEYFELLAHLAVNNAKLISFEGHEVYFGTAHPYKPMKSLVGNLLAKKKGPFALVVAAHPKGYGVSIRGDGSIDVAKIASRYGGNGHPSSAGFHVSAAEPLPWISIEEL